METTLPNNWFPRHYQVPLWSYMQDAVLRGEPARADAVWHRRGGKDSVAINFCAWAAFQRVGIYWHVLPTYAQGRKIVWEGRTKEGRPFLDAFPDHLRAGIRNDEMTLWLKNGSLYQVIGADQVNSLVGTNPVGLIVSEYSLQDPAFWDFIRPVLAENRGWAMFIYTPRGRNHAYDLHTRAAKMQEKNGSWFSQVLTVDDTGAVPPEAIQAERDSGMPEELIQQEFYCSFDAALVGAYFGEHIRRCREENRILQLPYDEKFPVDTGWDLGKDDATVIWFNQRIGGFNNLIDCYAGRDTGASHYAGVLNGRDFSYGKHYFPHDVKVQEWGSGQTRIETLREHGIIARPVPKLAKADQIQAARNFLSTARFQEETDMQVKAIRALSEYTKKWDDRLKCYLDDPLHDWTSDFADALMSLAVGVGSPDRRESRRGTRRARRPAIV